MFRRLGLHMSQYVGRGEKRCKQILSHLFDCQVIEQVPISSLIKDSIDELGSEHSKHKCDLLVLTHPPIAVEVNYKHGKKAHEKWRVYKEHLLNANIRILTIDDHECVTLFNTEKERDLVWKDYIDVIHALWINNIFCPKIIN